MFASSGVSVVRIHVGSTFGIEADFVLNLATTPTLYFSFDLFLQVYHNGNRDAVSLFL